MASKSPRALRPRRRPVWKWKRLWRLPPQRSPSTTCVRPWISQSKSVISTWSKRPEARAAIIAAMREAICAPKSTKPFFVADLVRVAKKFVDRVHLEKLQQRASRPGVIQGRLEEMGVTELMQSLEMGQKSCRLALRRANQTCELYFTAGQCKDARLGKLEGDAAVYEAVNWTDGEFEIDFSAVSDRTNTTRSTTGLLMEAMRLMDEASSNRVQS